MRIGFIGLGNMGGPMAANLAKAGHEVRGFDLAAPMPEGVTRAATATEAASGADVVLTMLPNGAILRAVAAEVIPAMAPGAVLCDCSTVDVDSARAGRIAVPGAWSVWQTDARWPDDVHPYRPADWRLKAPARLVKEMEKHNGSGN